MEGFKTQRLNVRNWADDIADPARRCALERSLAEILTPHVLSHLPDPLALHGGTDAIGHWITERARESDVLLIETRDADRLIGLLLLAPGDMTNDERDRHLGYLLAESAWGHGYATELVTGLIGALEPSIHSRLIGGVGTDNPASAHVLKKTGFTRDAKLSTPDTDVFVRNLR